MASDKRPFLPFPNSRCVTSFSAKAEPCPHQVGCSGCVVAREYPCLPISSLCLSPKALWGKEFVLKSSLTVSALASKSTVKPLVKALRIHRSQQIQPVAVHFNKLLGGFSSSAPQDPTVWASLAAMAMASKELNTAETAFAAIDEVDKLHFVQKVKMIPTEEGRNAELALYRRRPDEAEAILIQVGGIRVRSGWKKFRGSCRPDGPAVACEACILVWRFIQHHIPNQSLPACSGYAVC